LDHAGVPAGAVDWVCAHGTGTPASDGVEAQAVAAALADAGRPPAMSSIKGVLGHAEGAAAALEAIVAVLALWPQLTPGNATLLRPDPACDGVDLVRPEGRYGRLGAVLSPAMGFGGGVSTVLFT